MEWAIYLRPMPYTMIESLSFWEIEVEVSLFRLQLYAVLLILFIFK